MVNQRLGFPEFLAALTVVAKRKYGPHDQTGAGAGAGTGAGAGAGASHASLRTVYIPLRKKFVPLRMPSTSST